MPRKGAVPKRDVLPDPVYHSKTVAKFINKVMLSGKKSVAQRVVYDAFGRVIATYHLGTDNSPSSVIYTSSEPTVATVNSSGVIPARAEGTTQITAYFGEKGKKGTVKVKAKFTVK